MDNGGNSPAIDRSQKELSISLAASSMINASDMIPAEIFHANLKRIREVKEMVQRLESNNEAAHRNFLVDQLEKRAKDGREAESMLAQLRNQPGNQPGPSTAVQLTNKVPSDKSEVILPTTATLVEVPEVNASSYSLPAASTTYLSQNVPRGRPAEFQRASPYYSDAFRYYAPSPTALTFLQYNAPPPTHVPVDKGQPGRHTSQKRLPRSNTHNSFAQTGSQSMLAQQPSQPWDGYPPQVIALPTVATTSAYYTPPGWNRTPLGHTPSGSSLPTHDEPGISPQSATSRPTTHNQPLNTLSGMQIPFQGVPAVSAKPFAPPHIGTHPKPTEPQSQRRFMEVSKPAPHKPREQFQQQQPQSLQLPTPLQPQQQEHQLQRPLQPPQEPQQFPQSQVQFLSHQPRPPQSHHQSLPSSDDHTPSTHTPQLLARSSQIHDSPPVGPLPRTSQMQPRQPTAVQEQAQQRAGEKLKMDQPAFIRLFQNAVKRGTLQLKAFWFHARASGITDEWFRAAINSLPQDVWNVVLAQVNPSELTPDSAPRVNTSQHQVPVSVFDAPPPLTETPPTQSTVQQTAKPGVNHPVPSQISEPYATELQYYAEKATKSVLSAQMASSSTYPPRNAIPTLKPDGPQAKANVRTPKDANKSTLARDILHALGKVAQKPHQEAGDKEADETNDHEGVKVTEAKLLQAISPPASGQPTASLETSSFGINSSTANSNKQDVLLISQCQPAVKPVPKEPEHFPVFQGPIVIDLTLEDPDESIDEKEEDPSFLRQASTSAVIPPQPTLPTSQNISDKLTTGVAGGCDKADVHMSTPPSVLVAGENTVLEPSYSLSGIVESTSQSSEPLPSEKNEHGLDAQLPLFLPSPPVSPAPTEPPTTDSEIMDGGEEIRPSPKRLSMNADRMEIDTDIATSCVKRRRKQQVYVLVPPMPPYMKKAKVRKRAMTEGKDWGPEGVGQDEEFQYSHLEQLLIEESKLRLLERQCQWLNCGAILNCAANLLTHLRNHVREEASEAPFLCRWMSCQKHFSTEQRRDMHLEGHAIRPLPCPFAGCDKQFDKPVEVMQHEVQHQRVDRGEPLMHKPTCQPIVPAIPARLGPPPRQLPSHRVIPRRVAQCQISADRHATVGPWVLWNIFSPVELSTRKQNASMRGGRPTRQSTDDNMDGPTPERDDYDFLLALSPHPTKDIQLDDLDSSVITMSAARGLTLWGSGGLGLTVVDASDEISGDGTGRRSNDEDAVDRMLTVV